MSFLDLVFKVQDTYMVTGRGLVASCDILKGGSNPDIPSPVYWTDPSGNDREGVLTGVEKFAAFLGKPLERGDKPVGLLIRGAHKDDFEEGTIVYTRKTDADLLMGGTHYSPAAIKQMAVTAVDLWPEYTQDFHEGKETVAGFFVGKLMRATQGRLDPAETKRIVVEALEEKRDAS